MLPLTRHLTRQEYVVGQSVAVRYEPSNPADGRIDSLAHLGLLPGGMFFFAAVSFALYRAKILLVTRWGRAKPVKKQAAE